MFDAAFFWLNQLFTTESQTNVSFVRHDTPLFQEYKKMDKHMISYYVMGVSTLFLCCLGAFGNILSLCVLSRRSVGGPTTNLYLISLAVADLLVLFATILTAIKDSRKPVEGQLILLSWEDAPFIPRAYPYFHATAILFQVSHFVSFYIKSEPFNNSLKWKHSWLTLDNIVIRLTNYSW